MDRTERLLDLVALFLDAKEPISWAELRRSFPEDYGAVSDEAAERKFERDKAELLELGIPLRYQSGDDEQKDGYVVDREAYYLPEVGLTPEELAVLYAAGSAALATKAFPAREDLSHALRKIGFFAGTELPTPKVRMELAAVHAADDLAQKLEQLWAAAAARKSVELSYWSPRSGATTTRTVDPYGLALRRGLWSLVGFCHLRKGIRTFHVHRIRALSVNTVRPRSADFEVPPDFRIDDYVASYPWQHTFHPPVEVRLLLKDELAPLGNGLFPTAEVQRRRDGTQVTVRATDLAGLLKYALSLGQSCRVESPAEAVQKRREMLERILASHSGEVPKPPAGERKGTLAPPPPPKAASRSKPKDASLSGKTAGHERLRRLLFLVPYVSKHQGIKVDELARALSLSKEELLEDLDLLGMVGRPPFQPDDYIDIYVDGDRVFVALDGRLSAPPRLTVAEAAALSAAAEFLRPAAGEALESALSKLEKVLPPNEKKRWREMGQKLDLSLKAPSELAPLVRAIVEHREVEFDYLSASSGALERRAVRPYELFCHRGMWYLSAFDASRQDVRLFRVDRVHELSVTDRRFQPEEKRPQSIPNPAQGRGEVRVRFSVQASPYVKERFGAEARSLADGGVEVKVVGESERWLTQWVLSFGGDAVVMEPQWARQAVAHAAEASLKS